VAAGELDIARMLLAAGADAAALGVDDQPVQHRGLLDLVRLLLAAGADPKLRAKDGWTALQAAEMVGDDEIVALLRDAGAAE
jgi:ankyrin repeat protein